MTFLLGLTIGLVAGTATDLLDMSRTTVNVFSDLTATAFVAKSEGIWSAKDVPVLK